MSELSLILNRRAEVVGMIDRIKSELPALEAELVELDTAGKVMARLTGAEWYPAGEENRPLPPPAIEDSGGKKATMPEMIQIILEQAHKEGLRGLEPKEITRRIAAAWVPDVKGDYVSAITWRMWKRQQLAKVEGGLYRVPYKNFPDGSLAPSSQMNSATDAQSSPDTPVAEDQPSAQGGEARPGGGA